MSIYGQVEIDARYKLSALINTRPALLAVDDKKTATTNGRCRVVRGFDRYRSAKQRFAPAVVAERRSVGLAVARRMPSVGDMLLETRAPRNPKSPWEASKCRREERGWRRDFSTGLEVYSGGKKRSNRRRAGTRSLSFHAWALNFTRRGLLCRASSSRYRIVESLP